MSVTPPIDFDLLQYNTSIGLTPTAIDPLVYDPINQEYSIKNASTTQSGVITAGVQTLGGLKTFTDLPKTSSLVPPTTPGDLTTKGYVDDSVTKNISWHAVVISFWDFTVSPVGPADGDRYIAKITVGDFTENRIYQWDSTDAVYDEETPQEGWTLYCREGATFPDETITYTSGGVWVNNGGSINHQSLIGAGTLTHSTIDSYLNQNVKTTGTPSFTSITTATINPATTNINMASTAVVNVLNTTESSASNNGSLVVSGGVGVAKKLNVAGDTNITSSTQSVSTATGAIITSGGIGCAKDIYVGGSLHCSSTVPSTSTATGSLIANGGVGISKELFVGGTTKVLSTLVGTDSTTGALTVAGDFGCAKTIRAPSVIATTRMTVSGTGVTPVLFLGTQATMVDGDSVSMILGKAWTSGQCALITYDHVSDTSASNNISFKINGSPAISVSKTAVSVAHTTASTSTATGSLIVSGGTGIAGDTYIGGNLIVSGSISGNSASVIQTYTNAKWHYNGNAFTIAATEIKFTKTGNLVRVTMTAPILNFSPTNVPFMNLRDAALAFIVLPAAFRPEYTVYMPIVLGGTMEAGGWISGNLCVGSNGTIEIRPHSDNFPASSSIYPICTTYVTPT